jgi:hypothetical protein
MDLLASCVKRDSTLFSFSGSMAMIKLDTTDVDMLETVAMLDSDITIGMDSGNRKRTNVLGIHFVLFKID